MQQEVYNYLANPINILVIGWLSIYFIAVFSIFFYKFFTLNGWISKEEDALNVLLMSNMLSDTSSLKDCISKTESVNKYSFNACIEYANKKASGGINFLGIVASTSPFIGLFGTVVGILNAFSNMKTTATINMIAPSISEALIATAVGILVAIPAYSFHQILSKKVEDLITTLKMQRDIYLANEKA